MTSQQRPISQHFRHLAALSLSITLWTPPILAQSGVEVFDRTCLLCHAGLTKQQSSYRFLPLNSSSLQLAVITPRGPTLDGIVGRPVATISNFPYSKGMREFGKSGAVWDRQNLDKYLTDSRSFVEGTFMILKLNAEDRKLVIDYLESKAPYRPSKVASVSPMVNSWRSTHLGLPSSQH